MSSLSRPARRTNHKNLAPRALAPRPFAEGLEPTSPAEALLSATATVLKAIRPDAPARTFTRPATPALDSQVPAETIAAEIPAETEASPLANWLKEQAGWYTCQHNACSDLVAATLNDLADEVRFTGAKSPAEFEARRDAHLSEQWEDRYAVTGPDAFL
jgi:hypothetical protein